MVISELATDYELAETHSYIDPQSYCSSRTDHTAASY